MRWQGKALRGDSMSQGQVPSPTSMLLTPPAALMQFMGDQSKPRDKDEMDLLYELLKVSEQEAGGGAGRPEAAFLSSFLGLHGLSLPLVTMHSNRPEVFVEHLLYAGGVAVSPAG